MKERFNKIEQQLLNEGFEFERKDLNRPWGGFWVIDEQFAPKFIRDYFPELPEGLILKNQKVSPKILLVTPNKRLSWQYHFRRKEIWKVVEGTVGIIRSMTDEENPMAVYEKGRMLTMDLQERHRLIGLDSWGVIAEIWIHTDPSQPSDEDDIVRLQDDFKRKTPIV
ncbi:MAG: phosphoheptose isomerase [Bacteroidota bacterium]